MGAVMLTRAADGELLHVIGQPIQSDVLMDLVMGLAFTPDSAIIATAHMRGLVRLWRVSDGALLQTLIHRSEAQRVAFSPEDGATLASGTKDGQVYLWRVADGTLLYHLGSHASEVTGLAFAPDGTTLASGERSGEVRFWRVSDGALLRTLEGHQGGVIDVAFAPDGATLASASADKTVRLWQIDDGAPLRTLEGHTDRVFRVAFSPDGTLLASSDRVMRVWQVADGALLRTFEGLAGPLGYGVVDLDFSPDGATLACGLSDGTWRLLSVADGAELLRVSMGSTVYKCVFSPDGAILAIVAGLDATVMLWQVADGDPRGGLRGHADFVSGVAFSQDGTFVATGSNDCTVRLWGVGGGHPYFTRPATPAPRPLVKEATPVSQATPTALPVRAGPMRRMAQWGAGAVHAVAYAPDGQTLAIAHSYGIHLSDPSTLEDQRVLEGPALEMVFSPDGATLVTTSWVELSLWRVADGTLLRTQRGDRSVAITADGASLVTGKGRAVALHRMDDGALVREFEGLTAGGVVRVAISPDGRLVAGASLFEVLVWQASDGRRLHARGGSHIQALAFSPDGDTLAIAEGPAVHLVRMTDGALLHTLQVPKGGVNGLAFAPDGATLATACGDWAVRIWEVASGDLLYTLIGHEDQVLAVAYSPDGKTLLSGSQDNTVRLWYLPSDRSDMLSSLEKLRAQPPALAYGQSTTSSSTRRSLMGAWPPTGSRRSPVLGSYQPMAIW
jgi:WD40 repeat protein